MHHAQENAYNAVLAEHYSKKSVTIPVTNATKTSADYKTIVKPTIEIERHQDNKMNNPVIMKPHVVATPADVHPHPVVVEPQINVQPEHMPQEPNLRPSITVHPSSVPTPDVRPDIRVTQIHMPATEHPEIDVPAQHEQPIEVDPQIEVRAAREAAPIVRPKVIVDPENQHGTVKVSPNIDVTPNSQG
jgi:hypothetical protein